MKKFIIGMGEVRGTKENAYVMSLESEVKA